MLPRYHPQFAIKARFSDADTSKTHNGVIRPALLPAGFRRPLPGESPKLYPGGSHHPALAVGAESESDNPIVAFSYHGQLYHTPKKIASIISQLTWDGWCGMVNSERGGAMEVLDHKKVLSYLPDRPAEAHKGSCGKILLLCGSRGYTGAACLAAMGALRCGAGLVYLGVPESIYAIEAVKLNEPVVFPLPDDRGMLSAQAVPEIIRRMENLDAVLAGPGLGQSPGTWEVVRTVLERATCPVVLDADGINLLAGHKDILRDRTAPTVLTPHAGEFQRLGGRLELGRIPAAEKMARELGCIVLLKGHETCVTDGGHTYINPTGNPGMATGGSGDVLAGMLTALLGMDVAPLEAAACAAWLHGRAGDLCARELGQYAMLPTDLLDKLPRLLK